MLKTIATNENIFFTSERKLRLLSFAFLFCVTFGFCYAVLTRAYVNTYVKTCEVVRDRIFLPKEKTKIWFDQCLNRAKLATAFSSIQQIVNDFNQTAEILKTSHLGLFVPEESRSLWLGEEESNGLKTQFVDGQLVVFQVQPKSSAEAAGIRFGDTILRINGEAVSTESANFNGGDFEIQQSGKTRIVNLKPTKLIRDERIQVNLIGTTAAILKIPSFRSEYFTRKDIENYVGNLKDRRKVVVDLRGNRGGNFVAGLRFLSSTVCRSEEIGTIERSNDQAINLSLEKSNISPENILPDTLNDDLQIQMLQRSRIVRLKTYSDYPCLKAAISVLIDSETASTAEMVALALREFSNAKIYGVPSAGELLVSVWHDVDWLPLINQQQIRLSIPEALYRSKTGFVIEGHGVQPNQELFYNLKDFEAGRDTWILRVLPTVGL